MDWLKRPRLTTRWTAGTLLPAALIVLAAAGGFWNPRPALAGAVSTGSLNSDGLERTYRVYLLSSYDGTTPVPLVLVFHGTGGSGEQVALQTGFDDAAEREGFIAVYPDGTTPGRVELPTWNAGHCCGPAMTEGIDDVAFVEALLDRLEDEYAIDPARVYATRFSYGAMPTHVLGCELADRLAAIAPVSGTAFMDGCAPAQPLPVLHIHGTADSIVPYEGGFVENTPQPRTDPAVVDVIASWQTANDCPAAATTRHGVVTTELATECADGTAVELMTIAGGGHAWPGGRQARPGADPPSDALDATATIWAFFAFHPAVS